MTSPRNALNNIGKIVGLSRPLIVPGEGTLCLVDAVAYTELIEKLEEHFTNVPTPAPGQLGLLLD